MLNDCFTKTASIYFLVFKLVRAPLHLLVHVQGNKTTLADKPNQLGQPKLFTGQKYGYGKINTPLGQVHVELTHPRTNTNSKFKIFSLSHSLFIFSFCSSVQISREQCVSAALQVCFSAQFLRHVACNTKYLLQLRIHGRFGSVPALGLI